MKPREIAFLALAGCLAVIVYLNGLTGEFLYDDHHYILNNKQVTGEHSVFGHSTPSERPYLGLYRPLVVLSYRLNWLASGFQPVMFHATNVILHLLVTWVFYALLRTMKVAAGGALIGTLLFAVHPVHVEAVTWAVGRAEVLAALFCLITMLFHQGARRRPWMVAPAALAFGAACLSKENSFAFPAVLVLLDLLGPAAERGRRRWRRWLLLDAYILYALMLVAVIWVRIEVVGTFGPPLATTPYGAEPLGTRIVVAFSVLGESLSLYLWPAGLRIFYHASELTAVGMVRGGLVVLYAAAVLWAFWRRKKSLLFWLLWIVFTLVTVLNIVPIGAAFAERFLYLPSLGFCAVAGLGLAAACGLITDGARRRLRCPPWLPLLIVLLLVVLTWLRNPVFHDDLALWEDCVSKADFPYTHYNLGESYYEAGILNYLSPQRPGALAELSKSLEMDPDFPYAFAAHFTLGRYYLAQKGDIPRAVKHLRLATARPELMMTYERLAEAFATLAQIAVFTRGEAVSVEEGLRCAELARRAGFQVSDMQKLIGELKAL